MNRQQRDEIRQRISQFEIKTMLEYQDRIHWVEDAILKLLDTIDQFEDGLNDSVRTQGDNLCWIDFSKLYEHFGVYFNPARLGKDIFMKNCENGSSILN